MIEEKFNWKEDTSSAPKEFLEIAKKEGLSDLAGSLLYQRGVQNPEDLNHFLHDDLSNLHDPYLLHDMEKAVERIRQAIALGQPILVYGDYDADGMTSASIMKEALEMLGAECIVYLPNRFTDGYGPNKSVYEYYIEQHGIELIITVDNGVAGHEAIAYAQEQGVDVIVTDHHSMPDELPNAFAIIHPEHPESNYPFPYLAGCGVAFKVATALLEGVQAEFLDLVAIGTIADMVSLTDENRIMVKIGLEVMKHSERIGLQELMDISDVDRSTLNEETVGFKIGPQLNALGRLDDPNPAIELLTGFDDEDAQQIALMINDKNEERKAIVQEIYDQALAMVDPSKNVQVLAKEDWHPGVLGIVAGRLLERLNQPVIMLGISDGLAKGSARSIEALDIFDALTHHRDLFVAFGGHSGAAGMTLPVETLEALSQVLEEYIVQKGIDMSQKKTLMIDGELHLSDLSLDLVEELNQLAPFGMSNPKPVFVLKEARVAQARTMGQDGSHLKIRLEENGVQVDLVAFSQGHLVQEVQQLDGLEFAVSLSVNVWNGQTSLQLMLQDLRVEGVQLFDIRGKQAVIPKGVPDIFSDTASKVVMVTNVPEDQTALKDLIQTNHYQAIYFKNNVEKAYYLTGYGTRDQFAKLYRVIYQYDEFDVRYKLNDLANYLKIPAILLVKMIQIFQELEFVQITDGVMTVNKDADKREIKESQIYQDLMQQVKFQELMALSTPAEIYRFLKDEQDDE